MTVLARHAGATVVLVGHDSVNRALLLQLLDQPLSAYWKLAQDPCCLNEIDFVGGKIEIRRINDTAGLCPDELAKMDPAAMLFGQSPRLFLLGA